MSITLATKGIIYTVSGAVQRISGKGGGGGGSLEEPKPIITVLKMHSEDKIPFVSVMQTKGENGND